VAEHAVTHPTSSRAATVPAAMGSGQGAVSGVCVTAAVALTGVRHLHLTLQPPRRVGQPRRRPAERWSPAFPGTPRPDRRQPQGFCRAGHLVGGRI